MHGTTANGSALFTVRMPRNKQRATEPSTAPVEAVVAPEPAPEPQPGGLVVDDPPVTVVRTASDEVPDADVAFRHVTGDLWEVRVRLVNLSYPQHLRGRAVRTLAAHPGQVVTGQERRRLITAMG